MMKKKILFSYGLICFLLFLNCNLLVAQLINIEQAKEIGKKHLQSVRTNNLKSISNKKTDFQFTNVTSVINNNDTLFYILNDTINNGFVIVSADKRVWPILGYSADGIYKDNKLPEAFVDWMDNRKQEIDYIKKYNLPIDSSLTSAWSELNTLKSGILANSIEPLIKTKWDQTCFFNSLCPTDQAGPCSHVPTGCVATAMAQIMKYWNYPDSGIGSNSYNVAKYGTLSADFGSTTYQWHQMPDYLKGENNSVATLMYHCGVAVKMQYDVTGSIAYSPLDELVKYFKYSTKGRSVRRDDYSENEWIDLMKEELSSLRPIYYNGYSTQKKVGHAFICDGYQDAKYFHFNWGWGGLSDGYFYIGKLNSNSGFSDFYTTQEALIKIFPNNLPEGFYLTPSTLSVGATGGPINIMVTSVADWSTTVDKSWVTLNPISGTSETQTLSLNVSENNTEKPRTAIVTVTSEGIGSRTITVTQASKVIVTAGNLRNTLAGVLAITTNLTLTGTIDARDFKTMRDEMPLLTSIDLSGVKIAAYTGIEGPAGTYSLSYPANEIPNNAFDHSNLTSFVFPVSTSSIGGGAFKNCYGLKEIALPLSLTKIGLSAFYFCTGLSKVTFPSSLISIESQAFVNCIGLDIINIPSSVTSIKYGAFSRCSASINVDPNNPNYSSLDGVLFNKNKTSLMQCPVSKSGRFNIPETVTSIEGYAFLFCSGIKSMKIPSSVVTLGEGAFSECESIDSIIVLIVKPINLSLSQFVFSNVNKTTTKLYVPFGTKSHYATANQWQDFSNIIEMPGMVVSPNILSLPAKTGSIEINIASSANWAAISDQSWLTLSSGSGSPGLSTLTLAAAENTSLSPRTAIVRITAVGFEDQSITITQAAKVFVTAGGLLNTLAGLLSTTTNLSLTGIIDARDFKTMRDNMPSLTSIDLSGVIIAAYSGTEGTSGTNNLTYSANKVPDYAFYNFSTATGKTTLTSCMLPSSVTSIGNYAFQNCISLTSINIPSSLTSIGSYAFSSCKSLTSVTIPSSVTVIGSSTFANCTGLTSIYARGATPPNLNSSTNVFYSVNKATCTLFVSYGTKNLYSAANQWKDFTNIVETANSYPPPTLSSTLTPSAICSGSLFSYTPVSSTSGVTFNWTRPAVPGISNSSASATGNVTETLVNTTEGPIMVTYVYTLSINGSSGVQNVSLLSKPFPSGAGTITGVTTVCQGQGSVTYTLPTIANATSYIWTLPSGATGTSSTNNIFINFGTSAVSGNITVKGHNDCGDGAISTLAITVNPLPASIGAITGTVNICQGQSSVIYTVPTIANATSFIWTLPSGATGTSSTNSITVNFGTSAVSGNITVKGHNNCGEGVASTLPITVNPIPVAPIITQNGKVLHSDATTGNQWFNLNNPINGATAQDYTITAIGEYTVQVTLKGCVSAPSNMIKDVVTSISTVEYNEKIKVYPNPVSDDLTIEYKGNTEEIKFGIYSSSGQLITTGMFIESTVIHTSSLPSGVYTIKFNTGKTFDFRKVIKHN